ncbi:MAG: BON domain-containing protein [Lentisphaerae bacterium]|nr:BON domain-containing protein [Lentisphaerota bacterium]
MKATFPIMMAVAALTVVATNLPARASDTDDRIESSFKNSYVYKTYLANEDVKIDAENGAVRLSGAVGDESFKPMAQDTAEALPGVTSVDNGIVVTGERPAKDSDTWIGMKVKTALLFHRNVSATATDVFVKDGVVSLRGEATSQAEKDLTAEYARDVEGVKDVKNELTIAKIPATPDQTIAAQVDDASITAQVKSSLLSHRSTSAMKTKVQTTDGVVTVSGEAKNEAEISLVTKLVTDVIGVSSVVNNMTVAVTTASNQ